MLFRSIIERFNTRMDTELERERTEQSFLVPKEEIKNNYYDLSINKYKEIIYEKIEYDAPSVIIERIDNIDKDIEKLKKELKTLLNLDL